jgi:predicted site-specific integrase-resolvase
MTMTRADSLVDRFEAARQLKVSTRQVLRYVDAGLLTKHRSTSGHVRYSQREINHINRAASRRRLLADKTFIPIQRAS